MNPIVDLMSLLPENDVKRVVRYCLDTLSLPLDETERTLYDATKMVAAINTLIEGRISSPSVPPTPGERA